MTLLIFQSTHPLRDATAIQCGIRAEITNFNPRTPYGMRLQPCRFTRRNQKISIHAPLTGCDQAHEEAPKAIANISIHAPLTGCDCNASLIQSVNKRFQSTHPLRDATTNWTFWSKDFDDFNPRTPYGMRPKNTITKYLHLLISIHAPLTGCDPTVHA